MVAGRGIVHSERATPEVRAAGQTMHGIQSWVALPREHEDTAPRFAHHPSATLPLIERGGARLRVIAGHAFGERSPAQIFSNTLYVDADLAAGARIELAPEHAERAVYVAIGELLVDGERITAGTMAVLKPETVVTIAADVPARAMLVGGAAMDGPRLIWWNLVASDQARIDQAKADWAGAAAAGWHGRFGMPPDESEFIPLPEA